MKTIKNYQFKRVLVITGLAFLSFAVYAEDSGVIKGRVVDENNQPVLAASSEFDNRKSNKSLNLILLKTENMIKDSVLQMIKE